MNHLPDRPFQIDLHLHAGQERDQTLEDLVESFVAHGINFLGLLDHSELYEMGDKNLITKLGHLTYSSSPEGLREFYRHIDSIKVQYEGRARIFKAIEVPEWEIRSASKEAVESVDFLGCHLNTSCHDPVYRHYERTTCGEHLARRASQLIEVCRPHNVPPVLFHPFHRRIQELRAKADRQGSLGEDDEVFTSEDLRLFAERVDPLEIYFELNFGDIYSAASQPEVLARLARTCRLLKEMRTSFSLGSDYHRTPVDFRDPALILSNLGIDLSDLGLVRRLADPKKGLGRKL
jgi:histidinol phosphatase-like PHP family hydrolase